MPEIRIADAWGTPVAAGGGSGAEPSATTDANGLASPGGRTLGTAAGENALEAVAGDGLEATFTATAEPGPPAGIVLSRFATLTNLGQRVEIQAVVMDAYGNDTGQPVDWATSDAEVASVASSGVVETVRAGYAEVTATSGALGNGDATTERTSPSAVLGASLFARLSWPPPLRRRALASVGTENP